MQSMLRVVAFVAIVVAAPLAAQQPDSGMRGRKMIGDTAHRQHMGMMEPGMGGMSGMMMMGDMAFAPEHLLAQNGELQLTAQQITALTALRDAGRRDGKTAMDKAKVHMDELRTAMDAASPDTAAIRMHFLAAHDAMGQAHLAMLVTLARAKALLTDAQRAQVAAWREHMEHEHMGWHRHPMMRRGQRSS
jgi:Spy/CpxP family protein refolding chaperone